MVETEAFFDTNIFLYLLSADSEKADRAEALIATGGTISVQVLNEFATVASRKLRMSWTDIREVLGTIRAVCRVESLSLETHELGISISQRYGYSVYDSMILAAAWLAECRIVYTEDLQHGQMIDDRIKIVNPFSDLRI
jgi:predicted nucleic acid-binding protein